MTKPVEKISDSELAVLQVLWQAGEPLTVPELRQKLPRWESSTVKTLLRRLCDKGALRAERRELIYYTPLVSEAEYEAYVTEDLVKRVYRGNAKSLIAALVSRSHLSDGDIAELHQLLEEESK